jgi:tetratricopeptide (TPR) repeat protein
MLKEARAMAQLSHPNVVAIHEVGEVADRVYLAMEFVEGMTLSTFMAQKPSLDTLLEVFEQAGRGLEAAHAGGLVHRDFKPDNVLIADAGAGAPVRVKVTDFGLAGAMLEDPTQPTPSTMPTPAQALNLTLARTKTGALLGTPAYMAPEQFLGLRTDPRTDQFSFCVALFEAVHGRRPFAAKSLPSLIAAVTTGRRIAVESKTAPRLERLLDRGLSVDPNHRFPSMRALLAELRRVGRGRWQPLVAVGAAGAGLAVVGGLTLWLTRDAQPAESTPAQDTSTEPSATPPAVAGRDRDPLPAGVDPRCKDPARAWSGRWNDARRAAVRKAIDDGVFDDTAHEIAIAELDAWAEQWSAAFHEACRTGAPSRIACLDHAQRRFTALASEISSGQSSVAGRAVAAIERLPVPRWCDNDERTRRDPPPLPTDADNARRRLVRDDLAGAWAKTQLGASTATDSASEAMAAATALDDPAVLAEAHLSRGLALRRAGKIHAAAEDLEAAVLAAEAAPHPRVRTEAALALIEVVGAHQMQPAKTERWVRIVQADVDAFSDHALQLELNLARAEMMRRTAQYDDARRLLEGALADIALDEGPQDPRDEARLLEALAEVQLALEDGPVARGLAERALRLRGDRLPDKDPRRAALRAKIGRGWLLENRYEEAIHELGRANDLRAWPRPFDEEIDDVVAWTAHAQALAALDRSDEAEEAFDRAARAEPDLRGNELAISAHARWLASNDQAEQALARHDEAIQYAKALYGDDDVHQVPPTLDRIETLLDAGQAEQAATALKAADAITVAASEYGPLWAPHLVLRGRIALTQGDPEAALEAFDDAFVALTSSYGTSHPRVSTNVLTRADLAWDLGRREYAQRLYKGALRGLEAHFGADHPDTRRARERASP